MKTHQWTIDQSIPLTLDEASKLAYGHMVRIAIRGGEGHIYCRRCWVGWTYENRGKDCVDECRSTLSTIQGA